MKNIGNGAHLVIERERKSEFVRLFEKTPVAVRCPHFYELILSNGCPYDCAYCYLKLTFRGKTSPTLFANQWNKVQKELDRFPGGVFSTGELADSLAITPPLLDKALSYFAGQRDKYLLLVTKSVNVDILRKMIPSEQIVLSFSVNSANAAKIYEIDAPQPMLRLKTAEEMITKGWRVRIRLDPIILESRLDDYERLCEKIAEIKPERVTVGTLRQFPTLKNFAKQAPCAGLKKSKDGRMRYSVEDRILIYKKIEGWLGFQPALCKETNDVWEMLGWEFPGCNCTV